MSLKNRVTGVGGNTAAAMGSYHPAGTSATPMVIPLAQVTVYPPGGGPGAVTGIAYQDMTTMWGPEGEPIPATTPGSWGQLRAAGRP